MVARAPANRAAHPAATPEALEASPRRHERLGRLDLVDLGTVFNSTVEETLSRVHAAVKPPAAPASGINTAYYRDHLVPPFTPKPSDAAWRKKVGADGLAWTTEGIPFKTANAGPNIGVVTRAADIFPRQIEFPVNAAGRTLYLMISGTTFAMQSHVVNLRVTLAYADGSRGDARPGQPLHHRRLLEPVPLPRHPSQRLREPRRSQRPGRLGRDRGSGPSDRGGHRSAPGCLRPETRRRASLRAPGGGRQRRHLRRHGRHGAEVSWHPRAHQGLNRRADYER